MPRNGTRQVQKFARTQSHGQTMQDSLETVNYCGPQTVGKITGGKTREIIVSGDAHAHEF